MSSEFSTPAPSSPPPPATTTTHNDPSSNPQLSPADPSTFLTTPSPPNCTSAQINFSRTPLPEYSSHYALLIHHLLTPLECRQLLLLASSTINPTPNTWSPAEVNIGNGKQRMILEARNCGRIIWDSFPMAERLMSRIMPHLPAEMVTLTGNEAAGVFGIGPAKRGETWRISRLNERLRFLKYTSGMYFREHCDGSYVTPDGRERSYLTVHVYLNGGAGEAAKTSVPSSSSSSSSGDTARSNEIARRGDEVDSPPSLPSGGVQVDPETLPLKGGTTRFFSIYHADRFMDVNPEVGACLVFQHRGLLHSGEEVQQGVKYTVRSDVMYEQIGGC